MRRTETGQPWLTETENMGFAGMPATGVVAKTTAQLRADAEMAVDAAYRAKLLAELEEAMGWAEFPENAYQAKTGPRMVADLQRKLRADGVEFGHIKAKTPFAVQKMAGGKSAPKDGALLNAIFGKKS